MSKKLDWYRNKVARSLREIADDIENDQENFSDKVIRKFMRANREGTATTFTITINPMKDV